MCRVDTTYSQLYPRYLSLSCDPKCLAMAYCTAVRILVLILAISHISIKSKTNFKMITQHVKSSAYRNSNVSVEFCAEDYI